MSIGERLKSERERLGYAQPAFAALADTTKKSQIDYEKDLTQPKAGYLAAIAEVGADVQYIVTGIKKVPSDAESNVPMSAEGYVSIPKYEVEASAGNGRPIIDEPVVGHFSVTKEWVRNVINAEPGKLAIISVDGDSMEPSLQHGEQVLIDLRRDRFDNDAVYAIQYNGLLRIKRVQILHNGKVVIKSDNDAYEPETLSFDEAEQLHVIGRVLPWKFGKFKL